MYAALLMGSAQDKTSYRYLLLLRPRCFYPLSRLEIMTGDDWMWSITAPEKKLHGSLLHFMLGTCVNVTVLHCKFSCFVGCVLGMLDHYEGSKVWETDSFQTGAPWSGSDWQRKSHLFPSKWSPTHHLIVAILRRKVQWDLPIQRRHIDWSSCS